MENVIARNSVERNLVIVNQVVLICFCKVSKLFRISRANIQEFDAIYLYDNTNGIYCNAVLSVRLDFIGNVFVVGKMMQFH